MSNLEQELLSKLSKEEQSKVEKKYMGATNRLSAHKMLLKGKIGEKQIELPLKFVRLDPETLISSIMTIIHRSKTTNHKVRFSKEGGSFYYQDLETGQRLEKGEQVQDYLVVTKDDKTEERPVEKFKRSTELPILREESQLELSKYLTEETYFAWSEDVNQALEIFTYLSAKSTQIVTEKYTFGNGYKFQHLLITPISLNNKFGFILRNTRSKLEPLVENKLLSMEKVPSKPISAKEEEQRSIMENILGEI